MTVRCHYFPGGWSATAPAGNLSDKWDLTANTYTRYNPDGTVAETRPLTGDETTDLTTLQAQQTATNNLAQIESLTQQAISDNDTYLALVAPLLTDVTAQVRRLTRQSQAVARYLSTVTPQPTPQNNLSTVTDVTTP